VYVRCISTVTLAGLLLIAVPLAFNASFAAPAGRCDAPDILRWPSDEILKRYRQGASALVLVWWAFALTAGLFPPLVVLRARAISDADGTLLAVGVTVAVARVSRPHASSTLGDRHLERAARDR
jgi:hypothetical protein